jgi:hypothetical protein
MDNNLQNYIDFGFVSSDDIIYQWRNYTLDISSNILITKDKMYRFKNLSEAWNFFLTKYEY